MFNFSQLLTTKILHDFAGLISAVNNSSELLANSNPLVSGKALGLVTESAQILSYRLQFYRYAYGMLQLSSNYNLEQIESLTANFLAHKKAQVILDGDYSAAINPILMQFILCVLIFLSEYCVDNSIIKIVVLGNDSYQIQIQKIHQKLEFKADFLELMARNQQDISLANVHNVHAYYTSGLRAKLGFKLTASHNSDLIDCYLHKE